MQHSCNCSSGNLIRYSHNIHLFLGKIMATFDRVKRRRMQQKPLQLSVYIYFNRVAHSCCKNVCEFWLHLPHVSTSETLRNTWIHGFVTYLCTIQNLVVLGIFLLATDGLLNLPAEASVQQTRVVLIQTSVFSSCASIPAIVFSSSTKGVICFENTVLHSSTLIFYYILLTTWTERENQTVEIPPKV